MPLSPTMWATSSAHLRMDSFAIQFWMTGFSCVPRSVQWNASSRMIVGAECAPDLQYQRRRSTSAQSRERQGQTARARGRRYAPMEPSGRTRSTTIPIVFAKRTGLWGVFAGVSESVYYVTRPRLGHTW